MLRVVLTLLVVLIKLFIKATGKLTSMSLVSVDKFNGSLSCILSHPSVASPPSDVTVSRTGFNSVLVSWSAPSSAVPAGYEVFYQVAGGSTLSGGNTSNTELTLTGLTLGSHSFFVVAYGAEGAPVLPSVRSNTASVMIGEIFYS